MDWKKLASDAKVLADKAAVLAKQGYETSKEYAEKAKEQSYEWLVRGSTGLVTTEQWEPLKSEKRLAILSIEKDAPITKKLLLLLPIVFSKAWMESGTLRFIDSEGTAEVRSALAITKDPTLLIFKNGIEIKRIEQDEEIANYLKSFTFYVGETKPEENNSQEW